MNSYFVVELFFELFCVTFLYTSYPVYKISKLLYIEGPQTKSPQPKSTTVFILLSLNPKSSCNNDYTYLLDMLKSEKMKNRMSIYVCSDLLKYFVNNILSKINNTFVLVSGDSDLCLPNEALSQKETIHLMNSPYLLKWFVQNSRIQYNDKIVQMPIGLDYHTIFNNPKCNWNLPKEGKEPIEQEKIIQVIINNSKPFYERIPRIYVNFSINNDRFKQRKKSLEIIPKYLIKINNKFTHRTENWKKMIEYSFILSPFGIGMDCHRTWEALCLGCIPIICAPDFKKMFEDLPVLIINDWNEINEKLLIDTINMIKHKKFNYEKITLEYWKNQVQK